MVVNVMIGNPPLPPSFTDGVFRKQFAHVAYLCISTAHFPLEQFPKQLKVLRPSGDSSHGHRGYGTSPLFLSPEHSPSCPLPFSAD